VLVSALAMAGVVLGGAGQAVADPLLDEVVEFTGAVLFLEHKVPALVIGAVRDGETAIYGFGETSDGSEKAPGADTLGSARSPRPSQATCWPISPPATWSR
jgi:D-alanyl-D-alanine-carboxypeptidase/D-alanyl-D-alanine-endopeptidase